MIKRTLKEKLASRKLWAGIVAYTTSLLTAFNVPEMTATQITLIISGIGALIVYMLAEGIADCGGK